MKTKYRCGICNDERFYLECCGHPEIISEHEINCCGSPITKECPYCLQENNNLTEEKEYGI